MPRALPPPGPAPLWLVTPSRYAGLTPAAARWVLATLAVLLLLSLLALDAPAPTGGDPTLYAGIVEVMRSGGDYYASAADALRTGDLPLRPFTAFRLPTLAAIEALLPAVAIAALLYTLALATMLAWYDRLRPVLGARLPRAAVALLFGMGSLACWRVELAALGEVWAGLLVALSLARSERPVEAIGWGLAAALIRETAGLYLLIMVVAAWLEGDRRAAAGWGMATAVLLLALAAHAHAVMAVIRPLDAASAGSTGAVGPGPAIRALVSASALGLLPLWLGALLVAGALAGWTAWCDRLGLRVAATIGAFLVLLAIGAQEAPADSALLVTPVLLIGLVFVPDAVRDLITRALDRRRIVVRRISP